MKPRLIASLARNGQGRMIVTLACAHSFTAPVLLEPMYEKVSQDYLGKVICGECPGRADDEVAS